MVYLVLFMNLFFQLHMFILQGLQPFNHFPDFQLNVRNKRFNICHD